MIKIKNELLEILKKECVVATGCTEPIAVALAAATAREQMDPGREEPQEIVITVDGGLYKNAALVGIPGIKERGIAIAAALGAAGGDTKLGLRLLESISSDQLEAAKLLVNQNKIRVLINEEYSHLYIKVDLYTQENHIRVLTLDRHQNIVLVEKGRKLAEEEAKTKLYSKEADMKKKAIQKYDLQQLLEFVNSVDIEDIRFLSEGVRMGREIAEAGFCLENGFGQGMARTIGKRKESGSLVASVQAYCGAATEARMAGVQKPVMTSAGSGNHGLTVFLTNLAVAEKLNFSDEILLRAIALSNLITIYIKSFIGTLSAMCGCGVAAGVGAGAGIAYMFGGDERTIYHAMLNMTGSMAGILCDGGKKG